MRNGQNGRRRGRGGGGGGARPAPISNRTSDAGNRVEVRMRGNAHQLLEKYKALARDAMTQGDRVTAEYYMQYADHYYRVLSDGQPRREEPRNRNRDYEDAFEGEDAQGGDEAAEAAPPARIEAPVAEEPEAPAPQRRERSPRRATQPRQEAEAPVAAPVVPEPQPAPVAAAAAEAGEGSEEAPRRRRGRPRKKRDGESDAAPEFALADA